MMSNFLNNLWVAVSTPNLELMRFLTIPISIFLEIPLSLYLLICVFNIELSKKQKFYYIIST